MKRNYGVDMLRLLAMLFVTCLHVLGQGGVLASAEVLSANYMLAWLLETISFCAVNCFGLISGYAGVRSKHHRYSNLLVLLLQVCFYTVGMTLVFALFSRPVGIAGFLKSCWPFGKYWYFDAYFIMFLLMPAMNFVLCKLNAVLLKLMIVSAVAVCYFLPTSGYNFVWLSVLYMIGGAVALLDDEHRQTETVKKSIYIYISAVVVAWLAKVGTEWAAKCSGADVPDASYLIKNTSPMILIAALALLNVFSKLQLSGGVTKYIGKLSPLAFGVYLVHTEPHIWHLLKGYFAALANTSSVVLLLGTVGATVAIWSVCLLVDYMRFTIFKVCKLPQRCKCLEEVIVNGFARFVSRLKKR